jgi:hypothetical protein
MVWACTKTMGLAHLDIGIWRAGIWMMRLNTSIISSSHEWLALPAKKKKEWLAQYVSMQGCIYYQVVFMNMKNIICLQHNKSGSLGLNCHTYFSEQFQICKPDSPTALHFQIGQIPHTVLPLEPRFLAHLWFHQGCVSRACGKLAWFASVELSHIQ